MSKKIFNRVKAKILNKKPLPQLEEETKEGLAFFSRDITIINQDMVFSHLPEWKREQILEILIVLLVFIIYIKRPRNLLIELMM